MRTRRAWLSPIVVLSVTLLVTACASSPTPAPTTSASATLASPFIDPGFAELPAGSPLTVEDRKALRDVDGLGSYELADGTIVLLRHDEPLPDVVKSDASTRLRAMGKENEGRVVGPTGADTSLAKKLSAESGRSVFVIVHVVPSTPPSDIPTWPVYVTRPFDGQYYETADAAKAAAVAQAGGDASTIEFVLVDYVN